MLLFPSCVWVIILKMLISLLIDIVSRFEFIPFDDIEALKEKICDPDVCAFMLEPIQGDAGTIVPKDGYLKQVRKLCTQHNVLMIVDEVRQLQFQSRIEFCSV